MAEFDMPLEVILSPAQKAAVVRAVHREAAMERGRSAYHFAKTATARKMKDEAVLADEVGGGYRRGFLEAKAVDEAPQTSASEYVRAKFVLDRLGPGQRIVIDVEAFGPNGLRKECYATLYDKGLETPENEEGFVAAAEVVDIDDLGDVITKLFEDPDVGSL
jgi:hypothetical protein